MTAKPARKPRAKDTDDDLSLTTSEGVERMELVKHFCKRYRISRVTFHRLVLRGMPVVKLGAAVRIKPSVADEWLAANTPRRVKEDA